MAGGGKMRPLSATLSLLNAADGSAQVSIGDSTVLVAVYGPTVATGRITRSACDRCAISVTYRPAKGVAGTLEAERASIVRNALESVVLRAAHPGSVINVVAQVVSEDGGSSVLASSINAACLALVDAGIPMASMLCANSVHFLPADGESGRGVEAAGKVQERLLHDATLAEEQRCVSSIVFAFSVRNALPEEVKQGTAGAGDDSTSGSSPKVFDMVTMKMVGKLPARQVSFAISSARVAAATTFAFLKTALERSN